MARFGTEFTRVKRAMGCRGERQSAVYERRFVNFENGHSLAGFAEGIWEVEQCTPTVSSVAGRGRLEAYWRNVQALSG